MMQLTRALMVHLRHSSSQQWLCKRLVQGLSQQLRLLRPQLQQRLQTGSVLWIWL
jgi:hypothetical protein